MQMFRKCDAEFKQAYGILCASIQSSNSREALYPTLCKVRAGESSTRHSHFEPELFFISEGSGEITIGDETASVSSGDWIQIPPFAPHTIKAGMSADLIFLSVYCEDFGIATIPGKTLVTAAPPTPNGPLHLGHISGPYLASDIQSRYLRQRSSEVLSHCGTDDHQNYVPTEVSRVKMRARIMAGLKSLQIGFDEFIEPKSDFVYQKRIQDFAKRAIESRVIFKKAVKLPYCEPCDHPLVDALISGICPVCQEESCGGCEACGSVVPPYQLLNPRCSKCGEAANARLTEVYVFNLSEHLKPLQNDLLHRQLSPRLQLLIDRVVNCESIEVMVSQPAQGIRLPGSNHDIHVWFEMAAHYEQFATSDAFWVHSFGFDNAFYYLLFIPALLRAINPKAKLPDAVLTNDFLTLDGLKFSTSRGHAIWADEIDANTDHLRLFLSLKRPAHRQTDFSLNEFRDFSKAFETKLRELHERARLVCEARGEVMPAVLIKSNRFTKDMEAFYAPKSFDSRQAALRLLSFLDETLHLQASGRTEKLMIHALVLAMTPILPTSAATLLQALGESSQEWITDFTRTL